MRLMSRRPLVATVVTTVVGALMGTLLGAIVGRVIALFGDETVQTSVPVVFCGTLGYFVGGASAAKGSLDRFGARRSGLGATVATILLVLIVGGASVSRSAGAVVAGLGLVAAVLAGAAASLVSAPKPEPITRGQRPRAVPSAPVKEAAAAPEPVAVAELVTTPAPPIPRPAIRKVPVDPEPEPEPEPELDDLPEPAPALESRRGQVNWTLDEEPAARPRRDRPLRRDDAAEPAAAAKSSAKKAPAKKAAAKKTTAKKAPAKKAAPKPTITPPPAARPQRERPLRRGDS
jgi:ribonuclease E